MPESPIALVFENPHTSLQPVIGKRVSLHVPLNFKFSYLIATGAGVGNQSPLANTLRFGISFDLDPEETK